MGAMATCYYFSFFIKPFIEKTLNNSGNAPSLSSTHNALFSLLN